MARQSTVQIEQDSAGDYEVEIFDCANPRRVIVCSHGNGVRRWDGQKFFYAVAEHYADSTVLLVDQNQPDGDGVQLNPLPILAQRVERLIGEAKQLHPDVPLVLMGHSMGCGVITQVDLKGVDKIVFVTPGAGDQQTAQTLRRAKR